MAGYISNKKGEYHCKKCGGPAIRNEEFDAYFCRTCDEWLERHCGDKRCCFCGKRPEKPSEAAPPPKRKRSSGK